MKQIEVNGMVYEFDEKMLLKQEIRVGDAVQLLLKDKYSKKQDIFCGVVTQILPFDKDFPVVEVMYIENSYASFEIRKRVITNDPDSDAKIIKSDEGFLPFTKERAIDMLDQNIREAENKFTEAKAKKDYFLKYYNKYFQEIQEKQEDK